MEILKTITDKLESNITEAGFEGANIVLYTDNENFFKTGEPKIKQIVDELKKRIELRADKRILMEQDKAEKEIKNLVPKEADITNIIFEVQRSIVIIEAKKPGMVIGKQGSILGDIKKNTLWTPQVQRAPAIKSKITESVRGVLYANNTYRRRFLNSIGKKIYDNWNPEKADEWVRLTFLGSARQVGRSCILLQTPISKILLDCGVNVAAKGKDRFPDFNIPEFDIKQLDAVILSHAHVDHCLPPSSLVLTKNGYKKIDKIKIGEQIISMDWKTGKYVGSKCTEKTKTTGHRKTLTIKTPYSKIESSPNHRFFTFENMKLRELQASELRKGMLLPSNLLHKPKISKESITLDTNIFYDKRRKDKFILPKHLNPKLAEFLGYYMGDGHKFSERSLRLTDSSIQILQHHKNIAKELFNYEVKIRHHPDKTKNAYVLEINNIKIIRFLEENFPEAFLMTKNISVPEKIMNASSKIQKAFIKGFSDAEGSVTNIIKICSFSKKMLEDLQHLLSLQGIPSNIKSDNTICMNTNFSINKFYKKIGFSLKDKQDKLKELSQEKEFIKQDLMPITPRDLREILKQAGMFGRIHKSPRLSEVLPMALLDLFRRKQGYATRETAIKLSNLLEQRLAILKSIKSYADFYALRRLLSLTREEASISTGLKISQIQQIEENKTLSYGFVSLLTSFIKEKLSIIIYQTEQNAKTLQKLLSLNLIWEKIVNIEEQKNPYKYLVDIEVENHNFVAGNIITHNSGLIPYLYKMGYKGPVYMTTPTRDIAALLALDMIGVAYKQAEQPLYSSKEIKEMVKHSICLNYNEVTDIAPDVRLTFYNAGHVLGSAMVHLNIGNGAHNLMYAADYKYGRSRLFDPAIAKFPRVESVITEATYGARGDTLPPRAQSEAELIDIINKTIKRGGKILIPELGLGRSQETMLFLEDAIRTGKIKKIPIYFEGMIWDINAIHTAYPDFLGNRAKSQIFQDKNPFTSEIFSRVGSPQERKKVVEGGPCLVLATSGMLVGGASVEYLREFASNPKNSLVFVCYQGAGSLGRQIQDGIKQIKMEVDGKEEIVDINLEVYLSNGLTSHCGRNELIAFFNNIRPKPKRIVINHGEVSKCLDLASSLYKMHRVETNVPRILETLRLR